VQLCLISSAVSLCSCVSLALTAEPMRHNCTDSLQSQMHHYKSK